MNPFGVTLPTNINLEMDVSLSQLKEAVYGILASVGYLHDNALGVVTQWQSDSYEGWTGSNEQLHFVEGSQLWQDLEPLWLYAVKGTYKPLHRPAEDILGELAYTLLAVSPMMTLHGYEQNHAVTVTKVVVNYLALIKLNYGIDFEELGYTHDGAGSHFNDGSVIVSSNWFPQVHHKHLTVTELALLARISNTRAIRNAQYDSRNPLTFIKEGTSVLIEVSEARRWFKQRRSPQPSAFVLQAEQNAQIEQMDTSRQQAYIAEHYDGRPFVDDLLLEKSGSAAVYYSPFEYINPQARLVLVGISPGETQANNANKAFQQALRDGCSLEIAQQRAKAVASFSGALRNNLVKLLNAIGVPGLLGISDSAALFTDEACHLVHYTSVYMYPTLKNDDPISSAKGTRLPEAAALAFDQQLRKEAGLLEQALWLPLGQGVADHLLAISRASNNALLAEERILVGLPHPSGANAERISYFLGEKLRETLSPKTNPDVLDRNRHLLCEQIQRLGAGASAELPVVAAGSSLAGEPDSEVVKTPEARDGSRFTPELRRRGGYMVGAKGEEEKIVSYSEALNRLAEMDTPRWRRPNAKGHWGIVAGVRWVEQDS